MNRRRTKPGKGRGVDATGRSKKGGQYAAVPYAMIQSEGWRSLNGSALKVFFELWRRFHGFNNGDLSLSLNEAARKLGIGKATAQRAFEELESKGFIRMTRRGNWYGRKATTWALTCKPFKGKPPTNTWQKWRPDGPSFSADGYRRKSFPTP